MCNEDNRNKNTIPSFKKVNNNENSLQNNKNNEKVSLTNIRNQIESSNEHTQLSRLHSSSSDLQNLIKEKNKKISLELEILILGNAKMKEINGIC